ncbi:MAG: geranylgeranyl reductase family protein [Candidatus Zixiibacteriota bacterium]|nr:MAG: geranylgeranyl reductase family protein [candidate division Zixibacteria bacterium]
MNDNRTLEAPVSWQQPLSQIPPRPWDVVIIGAGPAGCTAAIGLAGAGHEVLLLDKAHFPREKVCGDCMLTDVAGKLQRLELLKEVHAEAARLDGIIISSPSKIAFEIPGDFVTLKRQRLDTLLASQAVAQGATFGIGLVTRMTVNSDLTVAVTARDSDIPLHARYAIVATGADIGLAQQLGAITSSRPSAIAGRSYVRSSMSLNRLVLSYDRRVLPGYGWIVPLGNGEYNVGCGRFLRDGQRVNLVSAFEAFIAEFPLAKALLREGSVISPLRAAPLRCGLRGAHATVGESILIAGETYGTTFALTGEGIGQAMATGEIAAAAVDGALRSGDRSRLREYPDTIQERLAARHAGFARAQRWISKAWLNDFIAKRARKSGYLRQALVDFIADRCDSRKVYSLGAMLRSYVS